MDCKECFRGMKLFFEEVIRINMMADSPEKEACARQLFLRLNAAEPPERFNWASDVFEALHVRRSPDKTALIWSDLDTFETRTYSYADLMQKANQTVNFLRAAGVTKGANLYIMSPILPEIWFACLACIKAGIIMVPTPATMTQRELEFRFETCPPVAVLADEAGAGLIDQALERSNGAPLLKLVMGHRDGWTPFDRIDDESMEAEAAETGNHDLQFCFFTSGTTGLPKRVGHSSVSYPLGHLSTTVMIGIRPDDRHHTLTSPGWAKWAWSGFFAPLNVGAETVGFKYGNLDGEQYLDAVARHGVTSMCAPPTAWKMMTGMNLDSFDLSRIRQSVSAGEPLSATVIDKWRKYTDTQIRDFYGQTETTAMIGNPPWIKDRLKSGCLGVPSDMYDVVLVDNEGNEIKQPGQVGHIAVRLDRWRAKGLFAEYIGSPDKMTSVFVDHYYYTGDKAQFDEDGFWRFEGRADDVIKSSDYRIGPFEVESALMEHPAVKETAVVGAPDPYRYQLVKAYVILNPGYEASRDMALELFKHAMTLVSKFKIPRIIEFVAEVPKTVSGKIRRVELRHMETARQEGESSDSKNSEYFYWDFQELSSRKS